MHVPTGQALEWSAEMPLVTNRFFLYDMGKVLLFTSLFMVILLGSIVLFSGDADSLPMVMAILGLIMFGFAVMFFGISAVFFGNRFPMAFRLDQEGVAWISRSRRGSVASTAAVVVGVLGRSPGTAGAGLLAKSQASGGIAWSSIRRAKAYPRHQTITLMNSWRAVIRLQCTPDNFSVVLDNIRRMASVPVEVIGGEPLPQTGRAPSGFVELLRRTGLVVGVCGGIWMAFDGPEVLISAKQVDFAAEMAEKYEAPKRPVFGAMGLGRELIRRTTKPADLNDYIARTTQHRLIKADPAKWEALHAALAGGKEQWFGAEDPAIAPLMPEIRRIYGGASWLVSYLQVGGGRYLEFRYENEPRESKAPREMVYPKRGRTWWWLLAGVLVYFLLPWAKPSAWMTANDRVVTWAMDLMGVSILALFFGLPLYAGDSIGEAFGAEFGTTMFLWALGGFGGLILLWSARVTSRYLAVEAGQLRQGSLRGSAVYPLGQIHSASYMRRGDSRTGVQLNMGDGGRVRLNWNGVPGFEPVLWALHTANVPLAQEVEV